VRLIDVLPTLARLGGVDEPLAVQGRDLGPLLRGEAWAEPEALCGLSVNDSSLAALRTRSEKLVVDERAGEALRFDLAGDPLEREPLPLADPARLEAALRSAQGFGRFLATRAPGTSEPDAELVESLRRLGYVGDE
jgi:hypothetical protein